MSDQCRHCDLRGNINDCLETECGHHENWISWQHASRYSELWMYLDQINNIAYNNMFSAKRNDKETLLGIMDIIEKWAENH